MILPSLFDHPAENFSYKQVQFNCSFSCLWEPGSLLQKTFFKLLPTISRTLHILSLVILESLLFQTQIIFSWIYIFNHLQLATSNPWHLKLVFNSQVVFLPCTFQAWLTWNPRAIASNRQTEVLASVVFFVFFVLSHQKHSKFPGRELNHGHCLSHNSFLGHCLSNNLFLATALNPYYPELKSFSPGYTLSITYNWLSQTPDISSYMYFSFPQEFKIAAFNCTLAISCESLPLRQSPNFASSYKPRVHSGSPFLSSL